MERAVFPSVSNNQILVSIRELGNQSKVRLEPSARSVWAILTAGGVPAYWLKLGVTPSNQQIASTNIQSCPPLLACVIDGCREGPNTPARNTHLAQ